MKRKENCLFLIIAVLAVILMTVIYIVAEQKNYGMEGDEVFSYISSTSMGGFKKICFLEDQTWYDADYFSNALSATGEERFNVKMVVENQAMDTHPPLYYLFLNLVCSVFPGKFSIWFGIGLNIFFMVLAACALYLMLQYFLKNRYMSLFLSTVFCCSALSVNMVLFIRMYVLLMALIIFQSWYHLILFDRVTQNNGEYEIKQHFAHYLILSTITILGALTHYYFLVYQCLIAFVYVAGLFLHRRYHDILRYIGTMAVSGVVYVCLYPAMLNHVFFKYRGREAVHKFLKEGTLFGDVISMFEEFNEQLFRGWFLPVFGTLLVLTAILLIGKKIEWKMLLKGAALILPSLVYFFGISKASPYVAIRYISPVAPLLFIAIVVWMKYLIMGLKMGKGWQRASNVLLCLILFLTTFYFFRTPIKSASFEKKKDAIEELAKETSYCVYVTADEYNWKMWEDYIYYPEFQGLFFIDGRFMNKIDDEKLKEQRELTVFIDKALEKDEICEYLAKYLSVQDYEVKYETPYIYMILAR